MKKVLLIAFHYPPFGFSSGIQRSLKFSEYLPDFGWTPIVLSADPRAYKITREDQLDEIPKGVLVKRAFGLDTARDLSLKGRYLKIMALPDRWVTWSLGGVLTGLKTIYQHGPSVIWSTYPIATAHLIGLILHRLTGIPWVADFRDSMTEENYPVDSRQRNTYRWIERQTIKHAQRNIFTTNSAISMYRARYPHVPNAHWELIPNGYDEKVFADVELNLKVSRTNNSGSARRIVLLHSGILYPLERDPRAFFAALANLKKSALINAGELSVILRATGHDEYLQKLIDSNRIDDIVFLKPTLPYESALEEMLVADGLLIFQAGNCNHQIPAKIYEYLRARRPILGLTDPRGDTANLLLQLGIDTVFPLDDENKIASGLLSFIRQVIDKKAPIAKEQDIRNYSRYAGTQQLACLFSSI